MVVITEPKKHLTFAEYRTRASSANQFKGREGALDQLRFGLFGEVGGVLAAVKKARRDQLAPAEEYLVVEELGDALWYLSTVADEYQLELSQIGALALAEMQRQLSVEVGGSPPTTELGFSQFDGLVGLCRHQIESMSQIETLARLGSDTGRLMTSGIQPYGNHPPDQLLAVILADIVMVAALFNLPFEKIAEKNIQKFESRWPPLGIKHHPLFDLNVPTHEQLPRTLEMHFIERSDGSGKPHVVQQLRGVNIGDRLTDNKTKPDGYRFHDVFHLAYMAHLGWSPVIRALLKVKRKSNPELDENQDGARAIIIEEGIATWIFNHADKHDYFRTTESGKLAYGLLKQAADMVIGYEVEACPLWQWERAILDGFKVWRSLCEAGRGIVKVDLLEHSIEFNPLELAPEPERLQPRAVIVGASFPPDFT